MRVTTKTRLGWLGVAALALTTTAWAACPPEAMTVKAKAKPAVARAPDTLGKSRADTSFNRLDDRTKAVLAKAPPKDGPRRETPAVAPTGVDPRCLPNPCSPVNIAPVMPETSIEDQYARLLEEPTTPAAPKAPVAAAPAAPSKAQDPILAKIHAPTKQPGPAPSDKTISERLAAQAKARLAAEKEMYRIRAKHLGTIRSTEVRQLGIAKLRSFTEPGMFPLMLSIFEKEQSDVRHAILDHFVDQKTDEADAAIAWAAIFDKDKDFRQAATTRLIKRVAVVGEAPLPVQYVIADGLKSRKPELAATAGNLAVKMKLFEAIPLMIQQQIQPQAGGGGGEGDLAWIMVGQQRAFIADLTPIVGDGAVAFDPTLGVITEGVILRVIDAVVISYNMELHTALLDLSRDGWGGQSTASLGWDQGAWNKWYSTEFLPYRAKIAAEAKAKAAVVSAGQP